MRPTHAKTVGAFACAVLLLVACGGEGQTQGQDQKVVKVGVLPLTAVAPVYFGIEQGFFAEEGLKVEPQQAQGGAAIIPAVVSGDFQFGYSNNVSLLLAAAKGLPLQIVTEGNQAAQDSEGGTDGIVVADSSDLGDIGDLEGKTVGVNTLQNIGEVVIKSALEQRGVDVSTIDFVETPFPEMVVAVDEGKIDAGWVVEPFLHEATATGMRTLAHPFFETAERLSVATYFTSDEYAEQNPETVASFNQAMKRSLEYAQQHPDEVREITQTYTEIPQDAATRMRLPHFTPDINTDSIKLLADLMVKYGLIDERPTIDSLVTK